MGKLMEYPACRCGNTLRDVTNLGYSIAIGAVVRICDECYNTYKREIFVNEHQYVNPELKQLGESFGVFYINCFDKACPIHSKDVRYYWNQVESRWTMTQDAIQEFLDRKTAEQEVRRHSLPPTGMYG